MTTAYYIIKCCSCCREKTQLPFGLGASIKLRETDAKGTYIIFSYISPSLFRKWYDPTFDIIDEYGILFRISDFIANYPPDDWYVPLSDSRSYSSKPIKWNDIAT